MTETHLTGFLKHENAVVIAALAVLTLLAWLALLAGAGTGMDPRDDERLVAADHIAGRR